MASAAASGVTSDVALQNDIAGFLRLLHEEILRLLHVARATGREVDLLSSFDFIDLLRAVLAADRASGMNVPLHLYSASRLSLKESLALVWLCSNCCLEHWIFLIPAGEILRNTKTRSSREHQSSPSRSRTSHRPWWQTEEVSIPPQVHRPFR